MRRRASNAEVAERIDLIQSLVEEHHPCSVRDLYYLAVGMGVVEKGQTGYLKVSRAVQKLRRDVRIPIDWIVVAERRRPSSVRGVT